MTFESFLAAQTMHEFHGAVEGAGPTDVERALARHTVDFEEYLVLLSPAAASYLEPLAQRAQTLTRERFGRVVQLYAPLYVSNECTNACVYCGFNRDNPSVGRP